MGAINRLRFLFDYKDGKLYWKNPTSNRVKRGDIAGSLTTNGYYTIRYDGVSRMLHRVIWDFHNEEGCSGFLIDHIDRNPLNNRIENLRKCNYSENAGNSSRHKDNTSGMKGVHIHSDGRYRSQISIGGKRIHLGLFGTSEEAHAAYCEASNRIFKQFSNGG